MTRPKIDGEGRSDAQPAQAPAAPAAPAAGAGKNTVEPPAPFHPIGRRIAERFAITHAIGTGGMGTVYAAIDEQDGAHVAVKLLKAESFTPGNVRRFRREAKSAMAVKSRYVCAVYDLGVEEGVPYIVMERLDGVTLHRRIYETGPLSAADAIAIMIQVLEGLAAAHAVGVIHRDIKPGNVIVTSPVGQPPTVKLIDFGLAKLMALPVILNSQDGDELTEMSSITAANVVPGTPLYLSPEQISGRRDLDFRVDVWAAGLTLYEMVVGRRPSGGLSYPGNTLRSLPDPSSFRSDLPDGFDAVLRRALAKRRDDRFASAAEFRAALVSLWACHRAAGVAHGRQLRKFGKFPTPNPPESDVEKSENAPPGTFEEPSSGS